MLLKGYISTLQLCVRTVGDMSKWKMVEVELVMYSFRNSMTVSCVTMGPWTGMVTLRSPARHCNLSRSAILLMYRDLPMPERVELTILTHKLRK